MKENNDTITLAHLSDIHLFRNKKEVLKEAVNTFEKFQVIIKNIRKKIDHIDAIVITGDLSEDGSEESYQNVEQELKKLEVPSYWLPGNHDNFNNIPRYISEKHVLKSVKIGSWNIIFLDTTIKGVDHGTINMKELNRLNSFLTENKNKSTLVCMHHPPIDVQSEFIDVLGLKNRKDFWQVVSRHSNVKGILFGHVHQVVRMTLNNIFLTSPPATCMQWVPLSKDFAFTTKHIGYQIIKLNETGEISQKVVRF